MIVIIGASSGVMQFTLDEFSKIDDVIGSYFNNKISHAISNLTTIRLDLCDEKSIKTFIDFVVSKNDKKLTILFASTLSPSELFVKTSPDDYLQTLSVNLVSQMKITRGILPLLIQNGWGRLIFFSSVVTSTTPVGTTLYSTTKAAVEGFSRSIAVEYGRFGITSNVLQLGYFKKGLIDQLSSEKRKEVLRNIPVQKLGDPIEIVKATDFIISSSYFNGQILRLSGGI